MDVSRDRDLSADQSFRSQQTPYIVAATILVSRVRNNFILAMILWRGKRPPYTLHEGRLQSRDTLRR
jgi:hypothetical protein